MPLDAAPLRALVAVLEEGSFERAATVLHITRSAVSQRIKLLEEQVGQVLVRRRTPCTPTDAGLVLLRHARQVALSEAHALAALAAPGRAPAVQLPLGVNADSLATWFPPALAAAAEAVPGMTLDVHVEDQDHAARLLREGRVMATVTSDPVAVQGCQVQPLGTMRYRAVCAPAFWQRYFPQGVQAERLAQAPTLVFNRKDALQERFVRQFTRGRLRPPVHWLPSPPAFVQGALLGLGWGMNPALLVDAHIASGALIDMAPEQPVDVALYWQHWRLDVAALHATGQAVAQAAARQLLP